jgi:hypothetical protein
VVLEGYDARDAFDVGHDEHTREFLGHGRLLTKKGDGKMQSDALDVSNTTRAAA